MQPVIHTGVTVYKLHIPLLGQGNDMPVLS